MIYFTGKTKEFDAMIVLEVFRQINLFFYFSF